MHYQVEQKKQRINQLKETNMQLANGTASVRSLFYDS